MSEDQDQGILGELRRRVGGRLEPMLARSYELGYLGTMPIADQVDLGTGGGVPGLVLVCCWPETRVVLMDASERRTTFLVDALERWPTVHRAEVLRGRAEELGRHDDLREAFSAVTSRSFGIPAATAECGSSFLEVGGVLVVSEPPDAQAVERWPAAGLATLGLVPEETVRPAGRFGYQVLRKGDHLDERFPRRVGMPVKRPVF